MSPIKGRVEWDWPPEPGAKARRRGQMEFGTSGLDAGDDDQFAEDECAPAKPAKRQEPLIVRAGEAYAKSLWWLFKMTVAAACGVIIALTIWGFIVFTQALWSAPPPA